MFFFSFQIATSLFTYVATFSRTTLFWEKLLLYIFRSNYFDTTVSFSEQLFLENSCFFSFTEKSLFRRSYFFRTASFSERNFTEQPLLENRKVFTALTFRHSHFFQRNCVGWRYLNESYCFEADICPCFDIVFAQLGVIPKARNKFVQIVDAAERYKCKKNV